VRKSKSNAKFPPGQPSKDEIVEARGQRFFSNGTPIPEKKPKGPGGRPMGAVSKMSRTAADRYVEEGGLLPIDVMGENMRFFFVEGTKFAKQLLSMLDEARAQGVITPAHIAEVTRLLNAIHRARVVSQQCAVDMAPYLHARLASITVKNEGEAPLLIEYAGIEAGV